MIRWRDLLEFLYVQRHATRSEIHEYMANKHKVSYATTYRDIRVLDYYNLIHIQGKRNGNITLCYKLNQANFDELVTNEIIQALLNSE